MSLVSKHHPRWSLSHDGEVSRLVKRLQHDPRFFGIKTEIELDHPVTGQLYVKPDIIYHRRTGHLVDVPRLGRVPQVRVTYIEVKWGLSSKNAREKAMQQAHRWYELFHEFNVFGEHFEPNFIYWARTGAERWKPDAFFPIDGGFAD